jgi:plasmid stabilization system protein ParE
LAEYVEALTQRVDSTSAPQAVDLTGVEQTIATIQGQLESLNQQFNARPEAQAIEQSQAAIAQLSEQLETVTLFLENIPTAQAITTIQGQLDSLNQQFNERPEAQAIEQLEGAIAQLAEYVEALTQRVDTTSAPPTVDLTGVEQTIATFQGQLESLNQQFSTRPETQTIEQLEGALAQLAEYVEALTQRVDSTSAPQTVDLTGVEQAISTSKVNSIA